MSTADCTTMDMVMPQAQAMQQVASLLSGMRVHRAPVYWAPNPFLGSEPPAAWLEGFVIGFRLGQRNLPNAPFSGMHAALAAVCTWRSAAPTWLEKRTFGCRGQGVDDGERAAMSGLFTGCEPRAIRQAARQWAQLEDNELRFD